MSECEILSKVSYFLDNENYEELEQFIIDNRDDMETPNISNALTLLPIDDELIAKNRTLYQLFVDITEIVKPPFCLRSRIRFYSIKDTLKIV